MAKQIRKAGSTGITSTGDDMMISPEMLENADPEAVADFEQMISGGEVASSLDTGDDDVPSHILAANMAVAKSKGGNSSANAADLMKLQQMQDRLKNSKEAFESGGNRGGKGGGFSRSG
jgi:hypothetical protein